MYKKLSIIIPIYNVEQYVRACLESVFRQGLADDDYELILVNDGTQDRSMEVIADLLAAHTNVTVINQENQGLSEARNTGLARATGEYVMFLDSDDLLVDGSLLLLVEKALAHVVDALMADFIRVSDAEINQLTQQPAMENITWKEKTGKQLFIEELTPYRSMVWYSLYKRDFLIKHHMHFYPGIYWEDTPFSYEFYLKANKCMKTNLPLIIYRQRKDSINTMRFTMKHARSFAFVIGKLWEMKNLEWVSGEVFKKLQTFTYTELYFMMDNIVRKLRFGEGLKVIEYLRQQAPNLTFSNTRRQKQITFLYRLSPRLLLIVWTVLRPYIK